MSIEVTKKGKVIIGSIITIIVILVAITRPPATNVPAGTQGTTTGFFKIPPQDADQLIKQNPSILIIDCNGDSSDYQAGRMLPRALWSTDASTFYGQHATILIYSNSDSDSIDYAKKLLGHVYGQIFVLMGGYQAWLIWKGGS